MVTLGNAKSTSSAKGIQARGRKAPGRTSMIGTKGVTRGPGRTTMKGTRAVSRGGAIRNAGGSGPRSSNGATY